MTRRVTCCAPPGWRGEPSGVCTTSRLIRTASNRPTWSCCTVSCAAIRTTNDCSLRPAGMLGGLLVFSYPRCNAGSRLVLAAQNLVFVLLRKQFRVFAHPPDKMLAVLREAGFRQTLAHRRLA